MARHTSLEERIQIIEIGQAGMSTIQIVQQTGWRPSTIRKWRSRARKHGRKGLASKMGRRKRARSFSQGQRNPLQLRAQDDDHCSSP